MKKIISIALSGFIFSAFMTSCQEKTESKNTETEKIETSNPEATISIAPSKLIIDKVLTAEELKSLTPDMVIADLKRGNELFLKDSLSVRDHSGMIIDASNGQHPKAVILSCLDSRVPVEDVFNKGIGDLFVARVAGNVVNEDILASMEYGCKVVGSKVIVVLGHGSCGAVKSAVDDVKLGNITGLLSKIKAAIPKSSDYNGEKSSKNYDYLDYVSKNNITVAIETIMMKSPILKEMADKGEIKIVGAFYNIKTGEVTFL